MKSRHCGLLLILTMGIVSCVAKAQSRSKWRDAEPKIVTLFSREHEGTVKGYGKSAFSFKHRVRSDVGEQRTRNNYDLMYGGINLNGDRDWFLVIMVVDDCSRIKDLGELDWSEVFEVPYLPASGVPQRGIRIPSTIETFGAEPKKSPSFEESSNGQVTKVVAGHMYVLHSKDTDSDFYTLLRVEKLVPGDEVTISWKAVPSPKAKN